MLDQFLKQSYDTYLFSIPSKSVSMLFGFSSSFLVAFSRAKARICNKIWDNDIWFVDLSGDQL
jgi:hypothetical protein